MTETTKLEAIRKMARDEHGDFTLSKLVENGLLTPNEVRSLFGLPPAFNGDNLKLLTRSPTALSSVTVNTPSP